MARFQKFRGRLKRRLQFRRRFRESRNAYRRNRRSGMSRRKAARHSGAKHSIPEFLIMGGVIYLIIHNWAKLKTMITGKP